MAPLILVRENLPKILFDGPAQQGDTLMWSKGYSGVDIVNALTSSHAILCIRIQPQVGRAWQTQDAKALIELAAQTEEYFLASATESHEQGGMNRAKNGVLTWGRQCRNPPLKRSV